MRPRFVRRGRAWGGAVGQVLAHVQELLEGAGDGTGHALLVTIEGLDAAGGLGEALEGQAVENGLRDAGVRFPELPSIEGAGFEHQGGLVVDGALAAPLGGAEDVGQLRFEEIVWADGVHVLLTAPVITFGVLTGQDDGGGSETMPQAVIAGSQFTLNCVRSGGLLSVDPVGGQLPRGYGLPFDYFLP